MKRSQCTVEKLKELGYKAMCTIESWYNFRRFECEPKQAQRVFEVVVEAVLDGDSIEIVPNDCTHTVSVFVENLNIEKAKVRYYLTRPMTEAEALEADIRTGRGKDWDYIERK